MEAKDLITEDNVIRTYTVGKYVCFDCVGRGCFNGFTVKLDPNKVPKKANEEK